MTVDDVRTRRSLDWGRVAFVPVLALLLLGNGVTFARRLVEADDSGTVGLIASLVTSALTVAFYAVATVAYLRRRPASSTTVSSPAKAAAVIATFLPFLFPLAGSGSSDSVARNVASSSLLLLGMAWSVWAISSLGRNLSIVAQVRQLVTGGPYQWVRHPLYLGELVAALGLAVREATVLSFALWLLLVVLQVYRADHEERLLASAFPDYAAYRQRSARLVPGLY